MLLPPEPHWMAICNLTPDSFSDGGRYEDTTTLLRHAHRALAAGATWLELGGESTRPGAEPISPAQERERVLPALEALAPVMEAYPEAHLAIDTRHASTAAEAIAHGAQLVNDVSGLRTEGEALLALVAKHPAVQLVLMHSLGTPKTMQHQPLIAHTVVAAVQQELLSLKQQALQVGVAPTQLLMDVGLGFGKTLEANFTLLHHLPTLQQVVGLPVLLGLSRKRCLAWPLSQTVALPEDEALPPMQREAATAVLTQQVAQALRGQLTVARVHDVAAQRSAWLAAHTLANMGG